MKLIAEAGGTKTDWRLVRRPGEVVDFRTAGINAASMSEEIVRARIADAADQLGDESLSVSELCFYGAGLASEEQKTMMRTLLEASFPNACVTCGSDLEFAALALFNGKPGIVAIMGTGANCCFFDGERIDSKVGAGGFILGDEGGGAALGRMLIADFIKGLVPEEVDRELRDVYGLDYQKVVAEVYRGGAPSSFLGSFAPYVLSHSEIPYLSALARRNVTDFFDRMLRPYDTDTYEVGVVGSFGLACKDLLEEIGRERGVRFSSFVKSPIETIR